MQVDINPRGNGACPLCVQHGSCRIQKALNGSLENLPDQDLPIEIVVYSCPLFKEKA